MLKQIAWNQLLFQVPPTWEIAKMGLAYLHFADDWGPTLELKWNRIKGTYSAARQLRRIAAHLGRQKVRSFQKCQLPEGWPRLLENYDTAGFTWQTREVQALGVLIYCPDCQKATLMQFFHPTGVKAPLPVWDAIVASFKDHHPGGNIPWAVFDIQLSLPQRFKLKTYRFSPGEFRLDFDAQAPVQHLTCYRFSPAATLLAHMDPVEFARYRFRLPDSPPLIKTLNSHRIYCWDQFQLANGFINRFNRRVGRAVWSTLAVWHLKTKNRILAVGFKFRKMDDPDTFRKICARYETI